MLITHQLPPKTPARDCRVLHHGTGYKPSAFDNRLDRFFPLDRHDVHTGHTFDLAELLDQLDADVDAFVLARLRSGLFYLPWSAHLCFFPAQGAPAASMRSISSSGTRMPGTLSFM